MREELKPCPFCGGVAAISIKEYEEWERINFIVTCGKCDANVNSACFVPNGSKEIREKPRLEAIKKWNARV